MVDNPAGNISEIDIAELVSRRASGEVNLIDVREPDEYNDGHVPGAILIPLGTVVDNVDAFTHGPVHIICRSGGRSMQAAQFLAPHGVDATNIAGGTLGWIEAGHAVVLGSDPG